jgi:hypothetical protein
MLDLSRATSCVKLVKAAITSSRTSTFHSGIALYRTQQLCIYVLGTGHADEIQIPDRLR